MWHQPVADEECLKPKLEFQNRNQNPVYCFRIVRLNRNNSGDKNWNCMPHNTAGLMLVGRGFVTGNSNEVRLRSDRFYTVRLYNP